MPRNDRRFFYIAAPNPTGLVKKTVTVAFLGDSVTQGCFEVYKKSENEIETVYDTKCAYSVKFKEFLNFLYPDMIIHILNAGVFTKSNEVCRFREILRQSLRMTRWGVEAPSPTGDSVTLNKGGRFPYGRLCHSERSEESRKNEGGGSNAGGGYLNPKTERREWACSFRFLCCELYK